ncbi:MAG TPA: DnaJ C-terminal domain-containing protein, partial [bacterium]|nr:DnaJ C-terminal domain-containing protein [bacterium]
TMEGKVKLKVPAGTQPNTVFRIRGEGFSRLGRKGRGDLLVKALIVVPKNLSEKQRAALRDFAQASGEISGTTDSGGIFKKVFG